MEVQWLPTGATSLSTASTDGASGPTRETDALRRQVVAISHQTSGSLEHVATDVDALAKQTLGILEGLERVSEAAGSARRASDCVGRSNTALDAAFRGIQTALERIGALEKNIAEVKARSERIGGIVQQLGILSINASIEASRAGEFGRGFGVVATEIRELARTAGSAADDIFKTVDVDVEGVKAARSEAATRIEKWRKQLFGYRNCVYVDDRLLQVFEGI